MARYIIIISVITCSIICFGFLNRATESPAFEVKRIYLLHTGLFIKETKALQAALTSGNEKNLQQQFRRTRAAYKKMETFVEYFFHFYAARLNGPPIPYFEEEEADMPVQHPAGMQVMEEIIFSANPKAGMTILKAEAAELVRYAIELPSVTESFAFDDANIFDAFMEELYRITALGIAGFDSQVAKNSLAECKAALSGLHQYIRVYQKEYSLRLPGEFEKLDQLFIHAGLYLEKNNDFIAFDRMYFITRYLDAITRVTGAFKTAYELEDNPGGPFYSAIRKNRSMFDDSAFNVNRFLDDFSTSAPKIELGRKLFFEPGLSINNARSCATCHQPAKAFTDGLKTSLALDGHSSLPRNAPTIWNAALQRNLFYDSRSRNLEEQVMQVLNNAREMHGSAQAVSASIISRPEYALIYQQAYPGAVAGTEAENICNAIACYERTLVSLNSRFDRHMKGKPLLTRQEINGFNLFMGKAKCGTCHFLPLFSGAKPPRFFYMESEVIGVPASNTKTNPVLDADSGRYLATGYPIHIFSFKTTSLRNAALTAPYMHNGVFNTLEEVMDFYNDGGGKGLKIAPANQSLPFDKLNLTKTEKRDIISFIKTLTDTTGTY